MSSDPQLSPRCAPWLLLLLTAVGCRSTDPLAAPDRPPSILFVFVDDLGYGDLGCYGGQAARTPNIDRLAAQGTRFEQFYVASPICSPSRVAVTTGQWPARWGIHSFLASRERNRARGMPDYLDPRAPSLARVLQQAGYATAHYGKWHMGGGRDVHDAPHPVAYGFGESLVSFEGLGDRILPPGGLAEQSAALGQGHIRHVAKHEMTPAFVDRALQFIAAAGSQPFYLQLWLGDVHDPHQPRADYLQRLEPLQMEEHAARFCAVLEQVDDELGRLLEGLKAGGLEADTLVLLCSDNGPTAWPHYYRQGVAPPGSTAGLRGRKWSLYEGGIKSPLIVRWPGHTAAGRVDRSSLLSALDLLPSLCALAGVPLGDLQPDGEDISPGLLGRAMPHRAALFWEYGGPGSLQPGDPLDRSPSCAMREGRWKLLCDPQGERVELYDLDSDPGERSPLQHAHPERAARMLDRLLAWSRRRP